MRITASKTSADEMPTVQSHKTGWKVEQDMTHRAYLCLGSNIQPEENLRWAVMLLRQMTRLVALSNCYETLAVGSSAPNYLNMAACIETSLDIASLKTQVLGEIERQLGRVRTEDKYASRTIDLDIIVYDDQVLDDNLWNRLYVALPCSELATGIIHPRTGQTLREVASRLLEKDFAIPKPEIVFPLS